MNKNIYRCLISATAFAAVLAKSCTANYQEINSDSYGVTKDELQRTG